ncbi:MAG TPA: zinc ABC transporter substrate-binding protein [Solirubrobacteraceae bacterium]
MRLSRRHHTRATAVLASILLAGLLVAGCGRSGPAPVGSRATGVRFQVVAAENFWGSLAAQLAGSKASVRSIIVNPATDPHSYQPTAGDARAVAASNMTIVNGLGYDGWASQLLQASASGARVVLNVGHVLGLPEGSNPHRWYYPHDVEAVIDAITSDYQRLDPSDAAYFAARRRTLLGPGLARYDALRKQIKSRFAGVPVGYSESIFQGLGEDLGLRLMTPSGFPKAVAEGTDVTLSDKQTVDEQATDHEIDVWVFNSQNVTPDVERVNDLARTAHIPIATITETLSPATASFQSWQVAELEALLAALEKGRR